MPQQDGSLSWPPRPPDMTKDEFGHILGECLPGYGRLAFVTDNAAEIYKGSPTPQEYQKHIAAGSCAVDITRKVLALREVYEISGASEHESSKKLEIYVWGFMMPREEVLNFQTSLLPETRRSICEKLTQLVHKLHSQFHIVHGDIKPPNILCCKDGTIRFCDFGEARVLSDEEDDDDWDGGAITEETSPPHRIRNPSLPPTINDDLYSLGVTLWMLYSHQIPQAPIEWVEDDWKMVSPIDVDLITDRDIREQVRGYLALSEVFV